VFNPFGQSGCSRKERGQERGQTIVWILLKNPSDQKATVKKTISDVSLDHSNRVQSKLARKNSRHFSGIFAHPQKQGVFQRNQFGSRSGGPRQSHPQTNAGHTTEISRALHQKPAGVVEAFRRRRKPTRRQQTGQVATFIY
jgi:hypothetical protein